MDLSEVSGLVSRVAVAPGDAFADMACLSSAVFELRRLRSWVEGQEVRLAGLMAGVSSFPEKSFADAGGGSLRDASRVLERVWLVDLLPGLGVAMLAGRVTGEHVDLLARRVRRLEPEHRDLLLLDADELVAAAIERSPERFDAFVRDRLRRIVVDDGVDRLRRQLSGVRMFRSAADDGMEKWTILLDPVSALRLWRKVDALTDALFSESVPEGCPTNPLEKQAFLRAHAFIRVMDGEGGGVRMGRPEVIVVVDARPPEDADAGEDCDPAPSSDGASGGGRGWVLDWGLPVEIPERVLYELAGRADIHAVVVRNGVVLHASGELSLGRSTRIANIAQRRVLRGLYPRCGLPGCAVGFDNCSVHHVIWWRHGGFTDLDNLLPLCSKHHKLVHHGGWELSLTSDRTVTVGLPDGQVMTTGPPSRRAA